jgi:hypothetical protein
MMQDKGSQWDTPPPMHNFLFLGCLKRAVLSLMPLAGGILEKK